MAATHRKGGVHNPPSLVGGIGAEKVADPEIQAACDSIKSEFLKQSGVNAAEFKAMKYKSQVVAGTNYFVRVWLGGDQFCHVKIYKPLPHTGEKPSLAGFHLGSTERDPITYF
ncbi:cystatin-A1-like [Hyla sarda]|uniref:cystatin-A1-like n=1 Tax=Hyla sarda TaxID=327740 RepID=UPI0024C38CD8|nr:cystatin-A1-like [Hyla sarda]